MHLWCWIHVYCHHYGQQVLQQGCVCMCPMPLYSLHRIPSSLLKSNNFELELEEPFWAVRATDVEVFFSLLKFFFFIIFLKFFAMSASELSTYKYGSSSSLDLVTGASVSTVLSPLKVLQSISQAALDVLHVEIR